MSAASYSSWTVGHGDPLLSLAESYPLLRKSTAPSIGSCWPLSAPFATSGTYWKGRNFCLNTDHKPLVTALTRVTAPLSGRQQRQLSVISEFTTDIHYTPGPSNVVADALSRPTYVGKTVQKSTLKNVDATVEKTTLKNVAKPVEKTTLKNVPVEKTTLKNVTVEKTTLKNVAMTVEKTTQKNVPVSVTSHNTCNAGSAPQALQRNMLVGPAHPPPHRGLCNAGIVPLPLQRNISQCGTCNAGLQTLQRSPAVDTQSQQAVPRTINPDWHVTGRLAQTSIKNNLEKTRINNPLAYQETPGTPP